MVTMVELEEQGPAMRVLGSLFKLTEVSLGRRLKGDERQVLSMGRTKPAGDGGGGDECGILQEDMELTKQMNALGLPVSFNTNKEKRNRKTEGKRKGMRLKQPDCSQDVVRGAMESSKVSEGEIVSPIIFDGNTSTSLCCFPVMGPSESSSSGATIRRHQMPMLLWSRSPASLIEMNCDAVKAQNHDEISGIVCNDGQDCDPLNSGLAPNDTMEVAASATDLDDGICPRGC